MQLGGTFVDVISDGTVLIDGGSMFGQVPKSEWELYCKPDRKNRVRLGLNCLLIRNSAGNILINTGAGSKRLERLKESHGLQGNKLIKGLKALGVSARDIDTVVLTDLQYDSTGGSTKLERSGRAIPAFPKATYVVQKAAWDEAMSPDERNRKLYSEEDFLPLEEAGVLNLLSRETRVAPGVSIEVTNGIFHGHQIILVRRAANASPSCPTIPTPFISPSPPSPHSTRTLARSSTGSARSSAWR